MRGELYREIKVWVRLSEDQVSCYRCFEVLSSGKFCVQSQDFFKSPFHDPESSRRHDRNFLELLTEQAPDERGGLFASLEEAIEAHDLAFSN